MHFLRPPTDKFYEDKSLVLSLSFLYLVVLLHPLIFFFYRREGLYLFVREGLKGGPARGRTSLAQCPSCLRSANCGALFQKRSSSPARKFGHIWKNFFIVLTMPPPMFVLVEGHQPLGDAGVPVQNVFSHFRKLVMKSISWPWVLYFF